MAPSVTPSLTISFIKPFSLIPHLVDYKLIYETGLIYKFIVNKMRDQRKWLNKRNSQARRNRWSHY